ncbi:putative DNA repair protein [Methylohalomonas lacus]|uniref:DNA repair protein n=1 Tax=Methylohalomonas lacus TaxID=398773 RepID=A0AAE3HM98_9GAMM|nr:PD-(D/E)XK nuclease family protein [Methylohalomonas lacus]MCS3903077.1 putative DNA repair protein [Methylohalomonas lacus]
MSLSIFQQAFQQGAPIITANDRLARQLRLRHADFSREAGHEVWTRAPIYSWQAWLKHCYDAWLDYHLDTAGLDTAGTAPPALLGAQQAEAVWQSIIEHSAAGRALLQSGATAASAAEARDLLCGWQVPLSALQAGQDFADHEDTRAFANWLETFIARSERDGWLDPPRLADVINKAFADGELAVPAELYLAGFDELRPQQQALLDTLAEHGCQVTPLPATEHEQAICEQLPCVDAAAEIRQAATWARQQLEQDPALNIGIVVQDLASQCETIARVFDELLCPGVRLPGADAERPYNISLGRPLATMPLVRDALLALELAAGPVSWTTAGALLRSPFLVGADSEADGRARLDARLRRRGREQVSLNDLHYHAGEAGCPLLQRAIAQCQSLAEQFGGRPTAATHAGWIGDWLAALGWSRGRSLSSAEYQTVTAWWELLGEFAQLDAYAGPLGWPQAVASLKRLANNRLFQPQSAAAPVQIMGLLEAAGLQFDRLWIMGLHDDVWPASPRPHPLLPIPLQRRYQLPHATAERELDYARRTTERLLASAPRIVVSWPQQEGDAVLRVSPLLAHLPTVTEENEPAPDLAHGLYASAPPLETFNDDPPPPRQADEPLRGGTAVLRNQAACPFRAFAEHRLHARALEEPVPGLDAAGRGALVHEVMRVVWDELRDQSALLALDANAQSELVGRCVRTALNDWETKHASQLPPRFREVEAARLQSLANDWLQLDRERAPFSVEARESEQAIRIEDLEFAGRIDRLDRLEDNRRLIIDYKTGRVDTRVWVDERPDDPQLPLYALSQRDHLAGIAFAQLRIGELQYAGVADRSGVAPGIDAVGEWKRLPPDCATLPDLLAYWQTQLGALARSFGAGDSDVDPKDPRQTCRYCPQYTLCRIDAISLGSHDMEAGDE